MQHRRLWSHCRLLVGSVLVALFAPGLASAESGVVQQFPLPRVRMRNSLTVEVDTRGVVSNGYRSVRVKLINTPARNKPPVPVTSDRRIRVVLEPTGSGHVSRVKTSKVIEIPEKQTTGEATIAIPAAGAWHQLNVMVYEGGDYLEDASGPMATGFFGMWSDAESLPTLLFVDYDVPDRAKRDGQLSLLATRPAAAAPDTFLLPDFSNVVTNIPYYNAGVAMGTPVVPLTPSSGSRLSDGQVLAMTTQQSKVQLLPPAELPDAWVELSCYDIAFISLDDLVRMAKQDARKKRALVDWLHGGPALVVYGVGDQFARLKEVEQLLDLPPLPASAKNSALRAWSPAGTKPASGTLYQNERRYSSRFGPAAVQVTMNQMAAAGPAATIPDLFQPGSVPFAGRPAGLGWVVAVPHPDPFPASSGDWEWILSSISSRHQIWSTRHGMSYQSYNEGIWNWYIQGVGAAPVFSFLLLATLFAVVIGPVNYLVLGKIHRLYLLLVTVPVGAAVVTLGLFAYAILSDGLGVKARIRSFNLLDQRTSRTVSWSRQSYYASLVPSQGLLYPNDAVIWPLDEKPNPNRPGPSRQVAWEAEVQRLRSGYLSSRRLTQLMVTRAARTRLKLAVEQKGDVPPQVTNELGAKIEQLILCDANGKFYLLQEPLAANQKASLVPLSPEKVTPLLSGIVNDHPMDFPEGYDPVAERERTESPWNRYGWPSSSRTWLSNSILENNINSLKSTSAVVPAPGTYVAVMERSPDVPLGVAKVTEADSFHVILGRW